MRHASHLLTRSFLSLWSLARVQASDWKQAKTIYDFTVKDLDENEVSLKKYEGNVALIVNVATYCGLTKANYKQLNELHDRFHERGLKILGFPCNQFNNQEPGCSVDIKEFLEKNKVQWDVFAKIDVNGDNADPLYKWLKTQKGGVLGLDDIKWNFSKFLIGKDGVPVERYAPTTEPNSIAKDIEPLL